MDSRRTFLKKASLLTGAAGIFSVLPASIQKAMAIDPLPGTTWQDAEHIVILMQENRSFDHCYGTLNGVRGFNDPRAIHLPNKNPVWLQSNAAGQTYAPFRLDMNDTKATWMSSLPHSWANQVKARNDGKHDKWLDVKRNSIHEYADMPLTMGYYNREDIPFYYSLADAFTVCDQHFCSSLTGTNPNRLFFWSGTVREEQHEQSRAHVWNDDMDYGTLNWKTFPERLEENSVSWKFYQNEMSIDTGFSGQEDAWLSNFQDNPLEFFAQYHIFLHDRHIEQLSKKAGFSPEEYQDLKDRFEKLSDHQKAIHRNAFATNTRDPHYHDLEKLEYDDQGTPRSLQVPKGDVLHAFREDVNNGNLPTVSWLAAPENFSDHPSSAWFGAWYVSEVMDILTKNPEVWKKTIFILTYDENDGYFDHVPPFTAPDAHRPSTGFVSKNIDTSVEYVTLAQALARGGFPENFLQQSSIGLGFRVPMVVASPWSRGGYVNSQVFDHTSTLQFLENFLRHKTGKNIREHNISAWRRTVCGDLSSVFRPYHGEVMGKPEFVAKDAFMESVHKAKFKKLPTGFTLLGEKEIAAIQADSSASSFLPQQEKGKRPSNALPYELSVNGVLSQDKKNFLLTMRAGNEQFGVASAGAPFNVYAPEKFLHELTNQFESVRTWAYAVSAGDELTDAYPVESFENGKYHLRVYGPNGFYREFTGTGHDPALDISVKPEQGRLKISIKNTGGAAVPVDIISRSYDKKHTKHTVAQGMEYARLMSFTDSHGWYDFSILAGGLDGFEKRFAGRVETGKESFSDPLLG